MGKIFLRSLFIVIPFSISFLFSSCSVTKRKYRDGYFITFLKHKEIKQKPEPENNRETNMLANASAEKSLTKNELLKAPVVFELPPDTCNDVIYFTDGSVVKSKIKESNNDSLRFVTCSKNDKLYTVSKKEVSKIVLFNGPVINLNQAPSSSSSLVFSSVLSFLFALLGFASLISAFVVFFILLGSGTFFYLFYLSLLASLLFNIMAFAYAGIAINKVKLQPDKYFGKGLAIAGMMFAGLGLILLAITLRGFHVI